VAPVIASRRWRSFAVIVPPMEGEGRSLAKRQP
jgi:hypothetical protein